MLDMSKFFCVNADEVSKRIRAEAEEAARKMREDAMESAWVMSDHIGRVCTMAASSMKARRTLPGFYTDDVHRSVVKLCNEVNLLGMSRTAVGKRFGNLRFAGYSSDRGADRKRLSDFDCVYDPEAGTVEIFHDGCMHSVVAQRPEVLTHEQYIYSLNALLRCLDEEGYIERGRRIGYFEIVYYGPEEGDARPRSWEYDQNTNAGKTVVIFGDNRFRHLSRVNTWDGNMGVQNCFDKTVNGLRFHYRGGEDEYRMAKSHTPGDVYSFMDKSLGATLYRWYNGYGWFNNFENPAGSSDVEERDDPADEPPAFGNDPFSFTEGCAYCIESEPLDGSEVIRKTYIYKGYIGDMDGCVVDAVVMRQVGGVGKRLFTLTRNDCRMLGIPYEPGLQVLPAGLQWKDCPDFAAAEDGENGI